MAAEKIVSGHVQTLVAFDNAVKAAYYIAGILSAYSLGANNVANATGIYAGALGILSPKVAVCGARCLRRASRRGACWL